MDFDHGCNEHIHLTLNFKMIYAEVLANVLFENWLRSRDYLENKQDLFEKKSC